MGKPRKVFVSVLGTGLYKKCKYSDGDSILPETRFIQQATLKMVGATGWTENDKILTQVSDLEIKPFLHRP